MPSAPPPDEWVHARRQDIGERIREARRAARLSQEALAERAGIDRQAINRIELGRQAAYVDNLLRIAYALDLPLADLVR
ncbi:helix-turn-helix transcriptional regulator [Streptomyces sp. NPDC102279]|uniref:helix-turn-helix transcriptional regulator n=1 Tax=Streptomyces sp. NPDC102279 TaxID=3366153 RepID=UPI003808CE5F